MIKQVITKLSELGLTEYEAKAYIALIQEHPATAYEVSKSSGVPNSKIYEVLSRLHDKTIICHADENHGKAKRYIPMNPSDVLERYQHTTQSLVDSLHQDFRDLGQVQEYGFIGSISHYEQMIDRALQMIHEAQTVILTALWPPELDTLKKGFEKAQDRGVRVALFHFSQPVHKVGQTYYHPISDTLYSKQGSRELVLVTDSQQVLMGNITPTNTAEGAWSRNRGFRTLAEHYIKHNIYLTKIFKRFEKDVTRKFGDQYELLRDIFEDREKIVNLMADRFWHDGWHDG